MTTKPWADEVDRYLRTGDSDTMAEVWAGQSALDRMQRAHAVLESALVDEVRRRSAGRTPPSVPEGDLTRFTRDKVAPMVSGLFPRAEHEVMLGVLERSVVFLTAETIESVLREHGWLSSTWHLANLYLGSVGADPLGEDTAIVGLSEETTCYVTARYFSEQGPFEDFVLHEAAHVFHNCKRQTVGLPSTRRKEWLLDIAYRKRETFAYSCEVYGRILARSTSARDRRALAAEYASAPWPINDDRVELREVVDLVQEASAARSGWKVILQGCAPERVVRSHVTAPSSVRTLDRA